MAEKKMTDWHRKVLCNFDNAWSATKDMREQIIEAQRFVRVSGAQWEGSTNAGYSFDEGRFEHYPRFELNKIARECDRIIGEYRQNRISVKFRPKDDKASEALAEKMNGKFRADYQETSGGEACDNAFDDAVTGGFGCFRMCADYEDEMDPSNEQRRISLLPVYDPATCVFFDQDSKQYDRSDAMWAMEMFSMTPKAFEAEYPDSIAASLSRDDTGTQYDWSTPDAIYVGRYYEVRIEKVKLTAWRNNKMVVFNENKTLFFKLSIVGTWPNGTANRSMQLTFSGSVPDTLVSSRNSATTTDNILLATFFSVDKDGFLATNGSTLTIQSNGAALTATTIKIIAEQ
ncbi:hypothetical protein AAS85_000420 [Escherichia coli]|nr:hypothetical protein [Escherichia coli]STK40259.1 phage portal protein [Escherichia coli]HAI2238235.1 hypothetical protein [Escherichia coli]